MKLIMATPDKGIPQELIEKARCIVIVPDLDDNATLYGKKLDNRDIVTSGVPAPKASAKLLALLNRYSTSERAH